MIKQLVLDNYGDNYLVATGLFTIVYQLLFFSIAYTLRFDKVTDFAGGSNFVVLALLNFYISKPFGFRATVVTLCITLWGARLAGFLLYRILKTDEDKRFDKIRNNFFKFLSFWGFQMAWVWIVSLPVTVTVASINYVEYTEFGTVIDYLGLLLFIVGLFSETIADFQKFAFRESNPAALDIMRTGIWKYSRHPNYFGEILLWWGLYLLSLPVTSYSNVYVVCSPLFTAWLLLFLSGIPLSDPQKEKKFVVAGKQEIYQEYIDSTSPLIPLPNEIYLSIPSLIKKTLLFDFPMYRYKGTSQNKKTASKKS